MSSTPADGGDQTAMAPPREAAAAAEREEEERPERAEEEEEEKGEVGGDVNNNNAVGKDGEDDKDDGGVIKAQQEEEEEDEEDEEEEEDAGQGSQRDIFVGNLSLYSNEIRLRDHFSRFGRIEDVRIMYHPDSFKSRRFGFITFRDPSSLQLVLAQREHFLDGKVLQVKHAVKRLTPTTTSRKRFPSSSPPSPVSPPASSGAAAAAVVDVNKVFVGGIGQDADESDVRELFSSLGAVGDVALLPDRETGRHRGFAFVTFAGEGAARAAEDACAKRYHSIKGKVKRAKPKKEDGPPWVRAVASPPGPVPVACSPSLLGEHPFQVLLNQALSTAAMFAMQQQQQQQQQQVHYQQQQALALEGAHRQQLYLSPPSISSPSVRYLPYPSPESLRGRRHDVGGGDGGGAGTGGSSGGGGGGGVCDYSVLNGCPTGTGEASSSQQSVVPISLIPAFQSYQVVPHWQVSTAAAAATVAASQYQYLNQHPVPRGHQ